MDSKSSFSPAQVKDILGAQENTLMNLFNKAIKRREKS